MQKFRLKRPQLPSKGLGKRIEPAAELQQRVTELAAGDGDELALEAVDVLQRGDVFERGDGAEQAALRIAHGGSAKAKAAIFFADTSRQQRRISFGGNRLL